MKQIFIKFGVFLFTLTAWSLTIDAQQLKKTDKTQKTGVWMMQRRNLEITEEIYEAFNHGDFTKVLEMFAPKVEWVAAENSPLGDQSPYRGLSEVRDKVFARIAAGLPGLTIKANEIFAVGDEKVVMLGYYDGVFKATGKSIHAQVAHIWTFSGGKVVKFQQYTDTYQLAKSAK